MGGSYVDIHTQYPGQWHGMSGYGKTSTIIHTFSWIFRNMIRIENRSAKQLCVGWPRLRCRLALPFKEELVIRECTARVSCALILHFHFRLPPRQSSRPLPFTHAAHLILRSAHRAPPHRLRLPPPFNLLTTFLLSRRLWPRSLSQHLAAPRG